MTPELLTQLLMDATGARSKIPVAWICLWIREHFCGKTQLWTLGSALVWGRF